MSKKISSFRELVEQLVPVAFKFRGKFDTCGYPDVDIRGVIFLNLKSQIDSITAILNTLLCAEENVIKPQDYRAVFGLSDPSKIPLLVKKLSMFCRLSLVTIIQFQIENFLKNILKELKPNTRVHRHYSKNLDDLFREIFGDGKQYEQDILMVFQHTRNSLHANGIHNNENFVKTIDGSKFEFIKGQTVDGVGWPQVILILNHIADILEEVVKTRKVKSLTGPISDQYLEN